MKIETIEAALRIQECIQQCGHIVAGRARLINPQYLEIPGIEQLLASLELQLKAHCAEQKLALELQLEAL